MAGSVCVFCGSRPGTSPEYLDTARELGARLACEGRLLVYGGGDVGLMGAVADGCLDAGGEVIGVIPRGLLEREVGHRRVRLEVVGSMHERKARMADLADGFVALPGGLGTFEELFEVLTWAQLGIHAKPIVALDVAGSARALVALLDATLAAGFMTAAHRDLLRVAASIDDALAALDAPAADPGRKWLERDES